MPMRGACLLAFLSLMPFAIAAAPAGTQPEFDAVVESATRTLCDKRIAVLAELPSHGEGQAFALKAVIVRRLIERCGFDSVLFEAPIYDFLALEPCFGRDEVTQQQIDRAIGKFWWAVELRDFRRWLHAEANGGRLHVGGIDDQVSITSERARALLPDLVASRSADDRASACRASVVRHLQWTYDDDHPFDAAEQQQLLRCARDAAAVPPARRDAASARSDADAAAIDAAMANSLAGYVARQVEPAASGSRDDALAANLLWHLARGPADSKVIVWTATVHASKRQGELKVVPMGKRMADRYGSQYGVLGFSAYRGASAMAGRAAKSIEPAPTAFLEARATRADQPFAYLDTRSLKQLGVIESRLFGATTRADWAQHFDAVVVVREESPAQFEALE